MIEAVIPMPLQVVLDDVGWWRSERGAQFGEPHRSGLGRIHTPDDYRAIVSLGRQLDMRPQAAMILCEWDRDNLLRDIPSATWMGRQWDNGRCVGPWLEEAADIICDNASHFELVLHGVGHEYWDEGGRMTRAEWFDTSGNMRPRETVLRHIDAYRRILDRNGLAPFPESFVPAAFAYRFGMGDNGFAAMLREQGVRFLSTPFRSMFRDRETDRPLYGMDCDTMVVDRGGGAPKWYESDCRPQGDATGPIVGLHWPNILHFESERNEEVVARWASHLRRAGRRMDCVLARDTRDCWSQLVYHDGVRVEADGGRLSFDFRALDAIGFDAIRDSFVLKGKAPRDARWHSEDLEAIGADDYDPASGTHTWRLRRRDTGIPGACGDIVVAV